MADKTVLDFPAVTDVEDDDVLYSIRGTGVGRDRHTTRLNFLQDILLNGVPEWTSTRVYPELVGMCQDEGIVWVFNGTGGTTSINEQPSLNQTKWDPVTVPHKTVDVSATGAIDPSYTNTDFVSDTSAGNNTLTIADPACDGLVQNIYSSGSGITYLLDSSGNLYSGASSTGIPITDKKKCTIRSINGIWVADDEMTAEWDDGDYVVQQWACGNTEFAGSNVSSDTCARVSIIYFEVVTHTFPLTLSSAPHEGDINPVTEYDSGTYCAIGGGVSPSYTTTTQCRATVGGTVNNQTVYPRINVRGKW